MNQWMSIENLKNPSFMEKPDKFKWHNGFKDSADQPELLPICGKLLIRSSDIKPTGMIPYPGAPPLLALYLRQVAHQMTVNKIRYGLLTPLLVSCKCHF
jgi:hypothetical protein